MSIASFINSIPCIPLASDGVIVETGAWLKRWHRQLLCSTVIWVRSVVVEAVKSVCTSLFATVIVTSLDHKLLLAEGVNWLLPLWQVQRNNNTKSQGESKHWYDDVFTLGVMCKWAACNCLKAFTPRQTWKKNVIIVEKLERGFMPALRQPRWWSCQGLSEWAYQLEMPKASSFVSKMQPSTLQCEECSVLFLSWRIIKHTGAKTRSRTQPLEFCYSKYFVTDTHYLLQPPSYQALEQTFGLLG